MQKYQRLHEMAAGVPDLVMREESLVRPGSGRPFAVSWLHGGGRIPHPEKWHYWHISKNLISIHGQLLEVRYLSHFPKFEIEFKYEDGFTLYSGQRTETYDLNFLSLGYTGEGPRYAGVFLAAVGFHLTPEEIDSVRPGDRITMESGKALIVRGAQGLSRAES